jgi:hypothetical protein
LVEKGVDGNCEEENCELMNIKIQIWGRIWNFVQGKNKTQRRNEIGID